MRAYLCVLLCVPLQGCLFFYIPSSLFASGNTCVGESAYIGQRVFNSQTGKTGVLKERIGRSERCQDGAMPILADVEF